MSAYLNRIATAVPAHDVHQAFVDYAGHMLRDERSQGLFRRMARTSGIEHRYSNLAVGAPAPGEVGAGELYRPGRFPSTGERMRLFESAAPRLMQEALDRLALSTQERGRIGHVIVTCCTGMYAPGLDFAAIDMLALHPETERTMIGFMGCYAAMNGLKLARHIVRSEPQRSVLLLNLELCTLHFQETQSLEEVLSFLVFADGCAASLISAEAEGLELASFRALPLLDTRDLITWKVRDSGFDMLLSGRVPGEISRSLLQHREQILAVGRTELVSRWAIHPGGRSILDAVQEGLGLDPSALTASRNVLRCFGNMSSATIMFVLAETMQQITRGEHGVALSFGPGLVAEMLRFQAA